MSEVQALSAVQASRFGDRIRKLFSVVGAINGAVGSLPGGIGSAIDFLKGIFGEKGQALLAAFEKIGEATTSRDQILAVFEFAKLATGLTATTTDDDIVAGVTNIASNEFILGFVAGMLDKIKASHAPGAVAALSDDQLLEGVPVEASAFDPATLLMIAKMVWTIIGWFRKSA